MASFGIPKKLRDGVIKLEFMHSMGKEGTINVERSQTDFTFENIKESHH